MNAPATFLVPQPVRMFEPLEDQFPTITRYWNEPAFRAELDAETQANRDTANSHFDAHRDAALAKLGYI